MKKKIIIAGAVLSALLIVLAVVFFAGKGSLYNKIKIRLSSSKENLQEQKKLYASNLELEELAQTLNSCKVNADCVHVPISACPCEQGGAVGAINKSHKDSFIKQIPALENATCPSFSACPPADQKPVCYGKKCYVSSQTLLSGFLQNKDIDGYQNALLSPSSGVGNNAEAYFTDIITSTFSEDEKISLAAMLIKIGKQPQISWFDWMLNNGQLELAKFFVERTAMPKTITPSFFIAYYNGRIDVSFIKDEDAAKQEAKRRFPLEHGFSLGCGNYCVESIREIQKNTPNGEKTKLFLMALGSLPKEHIPSRRIDAEVSRCNDLTQPCGSVKKALDLITPQLAPNKSANQVERRALLSSLHKYRGCRRAQDCALLTFGTSCGKATVATAVHKDARSTALKDGILLRDMRNLYMQKAISGWCLQETASNKAQYNLDCEKKICVAHPTKPIDVTVL